MSWLKMAMDMVELQEAIEFEGCNGKACVEDVLRATGLPWEEKSFPNGEAFLIVDVSGKKMLIDPDYPVINDAEEWVSAISSWKLPGYVGTNDFNEAFWKGREFVPKLYHGTQPSKVDAIMAEGLSSRNETRGISNRSTGSAVFTTSTEESCTYDEAIIEIDASAMRADGYTPEVAREDPIETEKMRDRLSWMLGLRQWENTRYGELGSEGIWEETVMVFGEIPPKYLKSIR